MAALYEMTMLLSIALIAIVATVFVIAASLLGRAIEEASREQAEIAKKKSEEFDESIRGLQQKLNTVKKPEAIDSLRKELDEYERKKSKLDKDSERISQRYGLLTVKGSVLYPSAFFLISLALAGAARYVETVPVVSAANSLWSLSLLALAWGSYRIYHCLKVIQSVAITTEEAQFKRMTQAFEIALDRHEESRRPKLELKFKKGRPPFSFKPGVEETIKLGITLKQGDVAKGAEAWFFAPEGFEFPGQQTWQQGDDSPIPRALTMSLLLGDLKRGTEYMRDLTIKTPLKIDEYSLRYQLKCEGFPGKITEFELKVE